MKTCFHSETRGIVNTVMRPWRILLLGLALASISGCEDNPSSNNCEADDNPGPVVAVSGDARLLIHVEGVNRVNIYLDGEYIGSLNPGTSRTWSIPSGSHKCTGTNAQDSYSPTSWSFSVAPGQTEERFVRFLPNPNAH